MGRRAFDALRVCVDERGFVGGLFRCDRVFGTARGWGIIRVRTGRGTALRPPSSLLFRIMHDRLSCLRIQLLDITQFLGELSGALGVPRARELVNGVAQ